MIKTLLSIALAGTVLAAPALAQDTLDRIKSSGQMTVATEAAFKPFEYVEDGKIIGFGSDLLEELRQDLGGVEIEQLDLPFQGILAGLAAGQYDLVATSVAPNPDRAQSYAFSRPFASIENVVVVPSDNDSISELEDLNGLLVGTQLGSSTEAVAREMNEQLQAQGGSGFEDLRLYQTFPDTAFALRSGQVDVIVIGSTTAGEFMNASPDTFKVALSYGDPVYLTWVTRPEDKALLEVVNAMITRLVESGELAEMQKKWIGVTSESPESGYLPDGAIQLQ